MPIAQSELSKKILETPYLNRFYRPIFRRFNELAFMFSDKYGANRSARRSFREMKCDLSIKEREVISKLKDKGYAECRLCDFISNEFFLKHVKKNMDFLIKSNQHKIDQYLNSNSSKQKEYLIQFYNGKNININDPIWDLVNNNSLRNVVNHYFGLCAKLYAVDYWYTMATNNSNRTGSQRWHRDPEDKKIIKIFLSVESISAEQGPMEYLEGTHNIGRFGRILPQKSVVSGGHLDQQKVRQQIVKGTIKRKVFTANEGSLIFVDTTGIHQGGFVKLKDRRQILLAFVSPASLWPKRFSVSNINEPTES